MQTLASYRKSLARGELDSLLCSLYGESEVKVQSQRYHNMLSRMEKWTKGNRAVMVSIPGRTELGGNHTDHNNGVVLAAAIHFDCLAVACPVDGQTIRIRSQGFADTIEVELGDLGHRKDEQETSAALVRGIIAGFRERGLQVGAFDACIASDVPVGAGLSSSAAFEVCVGQILNHLFNDGSIDPLELAFIGQRAENVYFGKPCGVMDQIACAVQGILSMDFQDQAAPMVRQVEFDFADTGYQLAVVDTGGSHADLTFEYAAIPDEMRRAARVFGQDAARGLTVRQVLDAAPQVRREAGDRALLRLIHFIEENDRAMEQADALGAGDMDRYLDLVKASGDSSWRLLQNCVSTSDFGEQGIPLALTMTERFLQGEGGWRVQGGGFAGTIQVFVPRDRFKAYAMFMEGLFGHGSTLPLLVRNPGKEFIESCMNSREEG